MRASAKRIVTGAAPTATYRLQFGPNLRFGDAAEAVPYLASLGVSHVYASPVVASRRGGHGYDVVDPTRLHPGLGVSAGFATSGALSPHIAWASCWTWSRTTWRRIPTRIPGGGAFWRWA